MTNREYIDQLREHYSIVRQLSNKNGGNILLLRHKKLGKELVLRGYPERIRAYELIKGYKCENLPLIYDVVNTDDGQTVLEEYIEGLSVEEIMQLNTYRYKGVKAVMSGLANALTLLHEKGIVHRDIKPSNIIVTKEGRVVLIDLNASRIVCAAASQDTVVMGTVGYASPEQLGVAQSDSRTDIYALGVLLNVMLTGKHPSESLAKGKAGRIVKKCTSINPDDRFEGVADLIEAL